MRHRLSGAAVLLATLLTGTLAFAEDAPDDSSTIKDTTKTAVASAIAAGKNLLGGLTEGVVDGRESAQGTDGAMVVSTHEQLEGQVRIDVLKVEPVDGNLNVLLGLKNDTPSQLRLINLRQTGALLAIDANGYSNALLAGPENPDDVTIPPKTGVRQLFVFEGVPEKGTAIRLWGQDFPLN